MSETRYLYEASWNRDGALEIEQHEITRETSKLIYYINKRYESADQIRKAELNTVKWSTVYSLSPEAARKAWLEFAKKQTDNHNEQLEKWYKRIDTLKEANDGNT